MMILLIIALIVAWPTYGLSLIAWGAMLVLKRKLPNESSAKNSNLESIFHDQYASFFLSLDIPTVSTLHGTSMSAEEANQCGRHIANYISRHPDEMKLFISGLDRWRTKGSPELCDPVTAARQECRFKAWGEIHIVSWRAAEAVMKNNRHLTCFKKVDLPEITAKLDTALSGSSKDEGALRREAEINSFLGPANRGDSEAQYRIGELLFVHNADLPKTSLAPAMAFLRKSAEQGHVEAQYLLGEAYRLCLKKAEAEIWYLKSSDAGNYNASCRLGDVYHRESESNSAIHFYEKSVTQGGIDACVSLANIFEMGNILPVDKSKAAEWYRVAAEKGDLYSQHRLEEIYRTGQGLPLDSDKAEYWLRQQSSWYEILTMRGDASGEYGLGLLLTSATNNSRDEAKGVILLRKAAAQGHRGATDELMMQGYDDEERAVH